MNGKILAGLTILLHIFIIGCSGNYATLRNLSESDSKATKQELIDNWFDYNIWITYSTALEPPRLVAIIFDPKNDDRKIMVGNSWVKVKDQEMWTEIVKANTTSDGELDLVWGGGGRSSTAVQEILGPDNQLYGFIVYQEWAMEVDRIELVDDNALRLRYKRFHLGGLK